MSDIQDATSPGAPPTGRRLTPHLSLSRVIALYNPVSGSVGARAGSELEAIFADYPLNAEVVAIQSGGLVDQIDQALAQRPDVLFILAGDGTAGTAASMAGFDGPLVAPLPGGTMNMLPRALYDTADWKTALRRALEEGSAQIVAGGAVGDKAFYCAAILGSPALWAPAREAVRDGKLGLAFTYARRALKRAFTGRLRYQLDAGTTSRTEALVLISPMISRALEEPVGLEAAAMDPAHAGDAVRLAANAVFKDWRDDPAVRTRPARRVDVRARSRIPAVIDGEPTLLDHHAWVEFRPRAFRALAPSPLGEPGGPEIADEAVRDAALAETGKAR